jgi:hypothetical protein
MIARMREKSPDDEYDDAETARRAEAVIKRMLNTPPQPRQAKQEPKEAKARPPKKPRSKPSS